MNGETASRLRRHHLFKGYIKILFRPDEEPIFFPKVVADAHCVSQEPADGDRPPDAHHPDGRDGGKDICQGHPGAQGDDGEYHAHSRPAQRPIEAIEKEETADAAVEGSLNAKVGDSGGNDRLLPRLNEDGHEGPGEEENQKGRKYRL